MNHHTKIRRASNRDLPAVAAMVNWGRNQGGFLRHSSRCTSVSLAAYMRRMRACFPYDMLVLEADGSLQGYVDFCELDGGVGYLIGVFVNQGYRRKALGTELMKEAIKVLRKRGCHKIRSEVYTTNHPATRLSRRLGFVREGLLRDDEGHHDLAIWSKIIAKA